MSAAATYAETGGLPGVLTLDHDAPTAPVSVVATAHDVFMERIPQLLNQLALCEEVDASKTKRVGVRGVILNGASSLPGVKFAADYKDGRVARIRIMTLAEDAVDPATVPVEMGGSGLMAPPSAEPKRKRAKVAAVVEEPVTLADALARAVELARLEDRAELVRQLDALLLSV